MGNNILEGEFYIKNRKVQENQMSDSLDKISEGFTVFSRDSQKKTPHDFEELNQLQNKYYKELQLYNQSIKELVENSRGYVNASNINNNKFHNQYVRDEKSNTTGYVTNRGVWKQLLDSEVGNSMEGKNSCPRNWKGATSQSPDKGEAYSIASAPIGEIVKTDGVSLIKGTPTVQNQTCSSAGENIYITRPNPTYNLKYNGCVRGVGEYQSDLETTNKKNDNIERCRQRAADLGTNSFSIGVDGRCYIGGSNKVDNKYCLNENGKWYGNKMSEGDITASTYANYTTTNANARSLAKTYHIDDNLTYKEYPKNITPILGTTFEEFPGYDSVGNDLESGTLSDVGGIEQLKNKCIKTTGCAGFVVNRGKYWLKSNKMWPNGLRQKVYNGSLLFVRNKTVENGKSCSKVVGFSTQTLFNGYENNGGLMTEQTTCALGTIAKRDFQSINTQYKKLTAILDEMKQKIQQLTREDIVLNERLLDEHNMLQSKLKKYEQTYKELQLEKRTINVDSAFQEDRELNMLSYNKQYILWSMLALGIVFGTMRIMKQ